MGSALESLKQFNLASSSVGGTRREQIYGEENYRAISYSMFCVALGVVSFLITNSDNILLVESLPIFVRIQS